MAPTVPDCLAFRGTLIHTPHYGQMDILLDRVVIVANGKIAKIAAGSEEQTVLDIWGISASSVRRLAVSKEALGEKRKHVGRHHGM